MSLTMETIHQIHPAQLGDLRVFGDPNSAADHLTNNIHPLWAYRNWSRNVRAKNTPRMERGEARKRPLLKRVQRERCKKLPFSTFQRILPALRLATLFLEKSLPWFWNLRYAPHKQVGRRKERELQLDEGEWTQHKERQIRKDLDIIAQRYFILHGLHGWEMRATGVTCCAFSNMDEDVEEDLQKTYANYWKDNAHLLTVIAKETVDFIGSPKWLTLPLAIQHRCLFQFTVLIVHELAHAVIFYRADKLLLNNEPYFRATEPDREVGFSWEHHMFGGIISVVDGEFTGTRPDGLNGDARLLQWSHPFHSHVQMFSEWSNRRQRMDDLHYPPCRWLIASRSIEQFFDIRRWKQWLAMPTKHGALDPGPFRIHLSPSLFQSLDQEMSMSYGIWYFRRLYKATGVDPSGLLDYDISDSSQTSSAGSSEEGPSCGSPMDTS
jgi:hypothetical protein